MGVLGCAQMGRERVEHHLTALTDMFDAAKAVVKTPFFFASDISDIARPIAIDGSWDLVERGYHREGIFWMVATYSRCQKVLYHDAPAEIQDRFSPGYRQLLGDLGITSFADLQQRKEELKGLLPRVWEVTEAILAANPGIEDKRGQLWETERWSQKAEPREALARARATNGGHRRARLWPRSP